jgi:pimeloyl-ACP methyl ester carboxylesterase
MRSRLVETQLEEVDLDGRTFRYRVAGSGEPLVLVHGLAGSWRWWSSLLEPLAERRRLYAVDLPRPGRSVGAAALSAWLARWLDAVSLGRVDLAGHSLGGLVAAELAARSSERTRRLVLVAPAGIPCGRRLPARALPLVETLAALRGSLPMVVGDAVRMGPVGLVRGIAFVSKCDVTPELRSVRAPTLIVWGERDHLVPLWVAQQWQRALPSSRLVLLQCGHVPMLEAPRELSAAVLSFLDEELADDPGDEVGTRVVDGMRLAGNDHEPAAR